MNSHQRLAAVPLIALALSLIPTSAEAETLSLWHAYRGDEREALEQVIRRINEEQDEFEIEPLAVPNANYASKLTSAIPRGHGPDIFIFAHERIGAWAQAGLIMSVEDEVSQETRARYLEETIEPLTFNGDLYGLPSSFKSNVLFYNTDLVDNPPDTTEQLIALARRLTDPAEGVFGLVYEAGSFYHHAAWLHGFGGRLLNPNAPPGGRVRLNTEANARSLAFAQDLVRRYHVTPEDVNGALVTQMFNAGQAAMVINGPWFLGEIGEDVDFAVTTLPTVSETGEAARPLLTAEAVFVSATTEHRESALRAMELLTGDESALTRALEGRQAVPNRAVWDDPRIGEDPVLRVFRAQLEDTVPMSNLPEMRSVWEPAQMAMRRVLRGSSTPEEALSAAQNHFRILTRPAPPAANPTPYAILVVVLLGVGAFLFIRHARRSHMAREMRSNKHAYGYLAPMAISVIGLVLVPFIVATGVSLFAHRGGEWTFVGLRNFFWILSARDFGVTDPMSFYFTLMITVLWTASNVTLHVSIGVALAMIMRHRWGPIRGVYRVLLIIPWAVPNYITALIWRGMFHRQFGAINDLLELIGLERISWFSDYWTALAANITTNTWLGFPFMMVVTLGALQSIPKDLEEAAEVDGAGWVYRFRHVILPLLKPALLPAVVLGSVWTFNMFNIVYLVSGGEPDGGSEILISEAYRWAFSRQEQYGYASAYGVLVFITLLLYSRAVKRISGEGPS